MEITKSLLFTIIIIAQIIGLVAVVWITHSLSLEYLHYSLGAYGLFALVLTIGTCIGLTEIHE